MRLGRSASILLILFVAACQPSITASDGPLTVTASNGRLLAANHGEYPLSIAATNPEWLGLIALCVEPGLGCHFIAPRSTETITLGEVHGYVTGSVVNVHYQELRPGTTPDAPVGARGVVAIRP